MDTLRQLFFEDPSRLYILLAGAELVILFFWWRTRRPGTAAMLLLPLVVGIGLYTMARLVVTDREQLVLNAREIAGDLEHGSMNRAEFFLDDQFQSHDWISKPIAITAGRLYIAQLKITAIHFTKGPTVEMNGNRANMHFVVLLSGKDGQTMIIWDLVWIKRPDGWRIISAEYKQGIEL